MSTAIMAPRSGPRQEPPIELIVHPHPLLELGAFAAHWPAGLPPASSPELLAWLQAAPPAPPPVAGDDGLRAAVRAALRHGGFKPSGRSKPASEYLSGAAQAGRLGSINPAVDAGNAASLHGGLPVSVVDLDRVAAPLSVRLGTAGERYVFNASGQEIELAGLPCLCDAAGPCASPVKDSHRSKTQSDTRRALLVVWGVRDVRTARQTDWLQQLCAGAGAELAPVLIRT